VSVDKRVGREVNKDAGWHDFFPMKGLAEEEDAVLLLTGEYYFSTKLSDLLSLNRFTSLYVFRDRHPGEGSSSSLLKGSSIFPDPM